MYLLKSMWIIWLFLVAWLCWSSSRSGIESFKQSLTYYVSCKKPVFTKVEEGVVNSIGLQRSENETNAQIMVPCGFTLAAQELKNNNYYKHMKDGWVMSIDGMDKLAAKDQLATIIHKRYGKYRSQIYIPKTWVLSNEEDLQDLQKYSTAHKGTGKLYILKKNIQRQEGLRIVNSWEEGYQEVQNALRKVDAYGYVVAQEVLRDPYTISGRKINIRCYVLFICEGNNVTAYLHDNGFVYYSKVPYVNGTTYDEIVTSGYIDREVYQNNPLTLKDLWTYLDRVHGIGSADNFKANLLYVLRGVFDAYRDNLCDARDNKVKYCQMFGADLQPDRTLTKLPLLELNKGASMVIMDEKDRIVKTKVVEDIYKTTGIETDPEGTNEFRRIWSKH